MFLRPLPGRGPPSAVSSESASHMIWGLQAVAGRGQPQATWGSSSLVQPCLLPRKAHAKPSTPASSSHQPLQHRGHPQDASA